MLTGKILREFAVPAGSLAVWWLGQAGFIFKSPAGRVIAVDPYLSNSCEAPARAIGVDHSRLSPPCIAAAELAGIDRYVLTHSHQDHLDPETLRSYRTRAGPGRTSPRRRRSRSSPPSASNAARSSPRGRTTCTRWATSRCGRRSPFPSRATT